jgi:hypothetical protein
VYRDYDDDPDEENMDYFNPLRRYNWKYESEPFQDAVLRYYELAKKDPAALEAFMNKYKKRAAARIQMCKPGRGTLGKKRRICAMQEKKRLRTDFVLQDGVMTIWT